MSSKEIVLGKLLLDEHNRNVVSEFIAFSLILILFVGLFMAVSIAASTGFAYSINNNDNATVTNSPNKDVKTIPSQVINFILDQIVNRSKAAIVIGFLDPNGIRIFSFGNMSSLHNIPVNDDTLFNIGSITKTFTTLLLADMVKQGLVNLTDPIEEYLPSSVKVPEFNGQKITLEHLATHTSGLPEFPPNFLSKDGNINPNYNVTQLYQALSDTKLARPPRLLEQSTVGMLI